VVESVVFNALEHFRFLVLFHLNVDFFLHDLVDDVFELRIQFVLVSAQIVQLLEHGFDGLFRALTELGNVRLGIFLTLAKVDHLVS